MIRVYFAIALIAIGGGALVWSYIEGQRKAEAEQAQRDLEAAERTRDALRRIRDADDQDLIDRLTGPE